ncbi:cache domain-containing sensor histidine kinase [Butyrivibrio sp. MC2013]|uniref:cache domain-containing sensor histidine kinase n=1 Tax=Butyrivibrio sp. MC2013 TaxID=1280686 RepID=UPI00041C6634|nr:sensor histidine kinase [Butyrivibrio sp. MC2013]
MGEETNKEKTGGRSLIKKIYSRLEPRSIQGLLLVSFTIVTVLSMIFVGTTLYSTFRGRLKRAYAQGNDAIVTQTGQKLESLLRDMRVLSDTLNYTVLKNLDLEDEKVSSDLELLYESNKNDVVSMAIYSEEGELIATSPAAAPNPHANPCEQDWFISALLKPENQHFTPPHVQNLFAGKDNMGRWVISLSSASYMTRGGRPENGVILVDMDYSYVEAMLENIDAGGSGGYFYLCTDDGDLIYHPRYMQIASGLESEDSSLAAGLTDGIHQSVRYGGKKQTVIVYTVSYTGWKLISIVPERGFLSESDTTGYFLLLVMQLTLLMAILLNRLISSRISSPIRLLTASIRDKEVSGDQVPKVYIGGSGEVRYLGRTLQKLLNQISFLMRDIVSEQEDKRKSELDALQSQINPHFLYNTLDSIVWMIEGGRNKDAVFMVSQLASLFRISLSQGRTIIRVEEELRHAENYSNIQKIRFRNSFETIFDVDKDVLNCCTVKLVIQPILENAIYYGVKELGDEGRIVIRGRREGDDIFIEVEDNGLGMQYSQVEQILTERGRRHAKGSGVGLINVHSRIRLRFGNEYGLKIWSEPDEGTKVTIHLPYIPYNDGNLRMLENGKPRGKDPAGDATGSDE